MKKKELDGLQSHTVEAGDMEMDFENRITSPDFSPEDAEVENPLRPRTLREYVGQEKAKENLSVFIEAARLRKESLDHERKPRRDACPDGGDFCPRTRIATDGASGSAGDARLYAAA